MIFILVRWAVIFLAIWTAVSFIYSKANEPPSPDERWGTPGATPNPEATVVFNPSDTRLGLVFDPKADDHIARWRQCLMAINKCIEGGQRLTPRIPTEPDNLVRGCVEAAGRARSEDRAACPADCVAEFVRRVQSDATVGEALLVVDNVFVDSRGYCSPTANQ